MCHSKGSILQQILHIGARRMKHVHIPFRETTKMQHSNDLLHAYTNTRVYFEKWLIPHKESAHQLQEWNFNWIVEGRYNSDWTIRPAISCRALACVVTWISKSTSQESHIVACKVFHEIASDQHFSLSLALALWNHSLDEPSEESEYFWLVKKLPCPPHYFSQ